MDNRILIVDDEEAIIRTVSLLLSKEGYDCRSATSLQAAKRECAQHEFDLGIVDLHLREDDGRDVLRYLRGLDAGIECIILTAFGTIGSAVECMRDGAIDYLAKPVDPTELVLRVRKALEHRSLTGEVERLRKRLGARDRLSELVAESRVMQQIVELIERIRGQDIPVLITGETGTGKEIVARAVHATSRRAEKPFIAINCNTLPEDLLDSELFGHLKGAYTGAVSGGKGLFQQAHGGTLFLDEIGDVSLRLQSKLLRVLQEGEVRPVGGTLPEKVDVRIIAATNQDLESLVANGEFRADLYFRLNVLPIHIPPLRQRIEDVPALIDNFLLRLRTHQGRPDLDLTAAARAKLMDYDYPGNVRELENILKRAFALSSTAQADADDIVFNRVGTHAGVAADPDNASLPLEDMILRHIRRVLALHNGNQVAAARALGISRSTLRRKLGQSS